LSTTVRISGCVQCKCDWEIPQALYLAAKASEKITFYCPYGHPQVFSKAPSEAELLRRERDRLKQNAAYLEDRLRAETEQRRLAQNQARGFKGVATRMKNRVGKGVCPCCSRTFANLQRHMASQHSGFVAEEVTISDQEIVH
jgi:hypothetical protein